MEPEITVIIIDDDLGSIQKLQNDLLAFSEIRIGNYIPVYTSLSIIITNSHKLIGIEFVRNKERR